MGDGACVSAARTTVERIFREEYGRLLAGLIRWVADFELAEEALQGAFSVALERWPIDGIPAAPVGWIARAARHDLVDRLRSVRRASDKLAALEYDVRNDHPGDAQVIARLDSFPDEDDRLRLIFTCCHPALALEARVALVLNALCGLTAREVGRAFLIPERTMAQRLVRAKQKIREAGIPFRVPPPSLWPERLPAVLAVCYLVFNEGHAASEGDELVRTDLVAEALRLARLLVELVPDEPEVRGLLALMLFVDARRPARNGPDGELRLLEEQDRTLWDHELVDSGRQELERALAAGRPGPYQIQAAIAGLHSEAQRPEDTDWPQIERLFDELLARAPSPVVELNRAVAVAMAHGPAAGLELVDELVAGGSLSGYHYLHATRADLLRRLDRYEEARGEYQQALDGARNESERTFLKRRLAELD